MPSRWRITLPGIDPALVRLEHVHAVVSRWFDADDTAHQAKAKPYSVTPAAADPSGTAIEVGLLDDTLPDRLHTVAAPGVVVRLGSQHARLTHPPAQVAAVTWQQLATGGTGTDAWCLRMLTPTTFRRGDAFTPWPAPKAILGSLRAAWRQAPADVLALKLDLASDPVWVTDLDGANEVVKVNNRTVSGFVGRIRFTCDAGPDVCAAVDRLVRLAPYAGVGAYTTRGFGVVRPEATWRQHRPT